MEHHLESSYKAYQKEANKKYSNSSPLTPSPLPSNNWSHKGSLEKVFAKKIQNIQDLQSCDDAVIALPPLSAL